MLQKVFTTTLLLFCVTTIFAQTEIEIPAKSSPSKAIRDLRDGVLIVRLTSDYRKIKELNRLLDEGDISPFTKQKLPDRIRRIISERDTENTMWQMHFKNEYNFSDVYFAFDTLRKEAIHSNDGKNCFLNSNFEIDPSISLDGRSFLMLYKGNAGDTGTEAIIVRDASFQELSKPFPYYIKSTSLMYVFNKVFKNSIAEDRNIQRMVKKLNSKLEKFYYKRS